jgi:hypothetical protein
MACTVAMLECFMLDLHVFTQCNINRQMRAEVSQQGWTRSQTVRTTQSTVFAPCLGIYISVSAKTLRILNKIELTDNRRTALVSIV